MFTVYLAHKRIVGSFAKIVCDNTHPMRFLLTGTHATVDTKIVGLQVFKIMLRNR